MKRIGDPLSGETRCLLVTIVRNASIDLYRKKQAFHQEEYIEATQGTEAYDGGNALARCILKLPPRQQDLLYLRYQCGYSLNEIARILGISYTNARQIASRAKEDLRKICQEEGVVC